uniref:ULP_PROTEASE domain-containing protein n=2 Tax=Meloidogyne hapla TaxID=6305 RepID=A0A1I8BWY2_MELHA
MDTLQINKILNRNNITKYYYIGCFASDSIPIVTNFNKFCMVVNTDTSREAGSHWVAIFCEYPIADYYDSLGIWPPISLHLRKYLSLFQSVRFNLVQIQHPLKYTCRKHRGSGLGSVFRSFLRYLIPYGKQIGSAIGKQGLESGSRVLTNVLEGKDLKETLIDEGKTGIKSLLQKAADNVDKQKGKGFDFKRYKNIEKHPAIGQMNNAEAKTINKRPYSKIGPSNFIPKPSRKSRKKSKRFCVDALGTY